jgi:hypothetical protein
MKLKGVMKRSDLEGGSWIFQADNGQSYQLENLPDGLCADGKKLEVEGDLDEAAFGIAMTGPTLRVKKASAL